MELTKQSVMKSGNLNPMWGKKQSLETRRKISDSQKQRYAAIRKALQSESVGKTDRKAKDELLYQAIHTDTIGFRDIQQALNFVAIMAENEGNYLQKVIKEELEKLLNGRNRHA